MFLDLLHSDVCCASRDGCVPTGPHVCWEPTFVLMSISTHRVPSPSHLYFPCKLNEFVTMLDEFFVFLDLLHSDVCCTPRDGGVPTGPHVCREPTFVLIPITAPSPSHLYILCKVKLILIYYHAC